MEVSAPMVGIGREQQIQALGKTTTLARLEHGIMRDLLNWARSIIPDPLDAALKVVDKLPEKIASELVRDAMERHQVYLNEGTDEVRAVLNSFEGNTRMLWLLMLKHQPSSTEADAFDLANALQIADELETEAKGRDLAALVAGKKMTQAEADRRLAEFARRPSRMNRIMETARGKPVGNGEMPAGGCLPASIAPCPSTGLMSTPG